MIKKYLELFQLVSLKTKENIRKEIKSINQLFSEGPVVELIEWNVKFGGSDNCFVMGKNRISLSFKNYKIQT